MQEWKGDADDRVQEWESITPLSRFCRWTADVHRNWAPSHASNSGSWRKQNGYTTNRWCNKRRNDWYGSYKPAQQAACIKMARVSMFLLWLSGVIPIPPFEFVCLCGAEVDQVKKTYICQVVHVNEGIMGGWHCLETCLWCLKHVMTGYKIADVDGRVRSSCCQQWRVGQTMFYVFPPAPQLHLPHQWHIVCAGVEAKRVGGDPACLCEHWQGTRYRCAVGWHCWEDWAKNHLPPLSYGIPTAQLKLRGWLAGNGVQWKR